MVLSPPRLGKILVVMSVITMGCWFSSIHAGEIDDLIRNNCIANDLELPQRASDEVFLRRVYLDTIGRIPTLPESVDFFTSTDPDKREILIDTLLSSEGYTSHWFHFWADLLRVSTEAEITRSGIVGSAYIEWIQNALDENRPCDQMVRDLIGRQGNIWEPENAGAVGFYLRDFGMPLEHFGILMQVFAGTRMECAQCHDHPFDRWTQKEFHQLAAFTYGVRASKYPQVYEEIKGIDRKAVNQITIPMRFGSVHSRSWPLKLPHDYAYGDAKPRDEVPAKFVFGPETAHRAGDSSSAETFARWLTDPQHPRFTRVFVNRLWKELFGAPLVPPPLDDLRDETVAYNPELEKALMKGLRDSGYDMRAFLATVMKSDAYQRKAKTQGYRPGERQFFESPYLRRMSAEQVWDSFVTLVTSEPDRPNLRREAYRERYLNDLRTRAEKICGKSPEAVRAWLHTSSGKSFAAKPRTISSPKVDGLMEQDRAKMKALDRQRNAGASGTKEDFTEWKRLNYRLYRASKLETPMPPGHFLRTFGQSDRSIPNNANHHSSTPQLLAIFNGELTKAVQSPWSPVMRAAQQAAAGDGARPNSVTKAVFLCILSRQPTAVELEIAADESPDILAASLLSTAEFLFVQ